MNDYLGNLADRALGLTPVVKPRLASMFEPVAAGPSFSAPQESIAAEQPSPARSTELPAPSPRRDRRDDGRARDREASRLVVDDRERPARESHDEPAHLISRSRTIEPRAAPQEVIERPAVPPRPLKPTHPAPIAEPPTPHIQPRPEIGGAVPARPQAFATPHARGEPDLQRWREADQRLAVLERRRDSRITQPESATRPPDREHHVRDDRRDRELPSRRFERATVPAIGQDPARAVHVTIGRVEVRAIMSPDPAARSRVRAARAASLSLDDYLKTRSGR